MAAVACADYEQSFIKEQLSLEAEAREALPYVSCTEHGSVLSLTVHSNLIPVRAISDLCDKDSILASTATRHPRTRQIRTSQPLSATPVPSRAMANTL